MTRYKATARKNASVLFIIVICQMFEFVGRAGNVFFPFIHRSVKNPKRDLARIDEIETRDFHCPWK